MTTLKLVCFNGKAKCKLRGKDYHLKKELYREGS